MDSILYITCLPKEYGGKEDGGVATHSIQLILKAKDYYRVGVYSSIKKISRVDGVSLYKEDSKYLKILRIISGYLSVDKEKFKEIGFLSLKDRLRVLYHYSKLKNIVSQYDVVHIHSLHNLSTTALSLLKSRPRIVVTDHGFWQGDLEKSIETVIYNSFSADQVIYISEYAKLKIEENKLNTTNIVKIYNPYLVKELDTKFKNNIKEKLNINANKKIILFSGVSEPVNRKGLDILLESVSQDSYLKDNTVLIIISNDDGLKYLNQYKNLRNVIPLKPMPYSEIIDYYAISDIFVLPSRSESFGLVYIEALSFGTPVIGFDKVIQEFQSIYSPIYIGESFNPFIENNEDLGLKIKKVLSKKFNEAELKEKTIELFSWEKLFHKFKNVYTELAKK
ncbi:glycosyltransferase family 4 protein [Paenibacillus sp. BSR1-1]|uniref:glycosyltransferase family 4 protein n=1 Tax=Paenibacillus sp. BSR1-1 TaxID=3020845 RepID=UPI0025B154EA|nr:glycosyltransferase family 4 protein [Paenibacillus sp. BSR1-1]MDN3019181.1 glycosyltransferase family 4 protein [Paenibacillus sp. BSR1-1]